MEQVISDDYDLVKNNFLYWNELLGESHTSENENTSFLINKFFDKNSEKRLFLKGIHFKSYVFEANKIDMTTMYGSFFDSCIFECCSITFSFFHYCFFKDCKFVNCSMNINEFFDCAFLDCVFENGKMYESIFKNCILLSCNFSYICIEDIYFKFVKFIDVCIKGAEQEYLIRTDTIQADLGSLIEIILEFNFLEFPDFIYEPIKNKEELFCSIIQDIFSREYITVVKK
jgi:uncharacterized protein YjbI with pentapeptide repeats